MTPRMHLRVYRRGDGFRLSGGDYTPTVELLDAIDRCAGIDSTIEHHYQPGAREYTVTYTAGYWLAACGVHEIDFWSRDLEYVRALVADHDEEWHQ